MRLFLKHMLFASLVFIGLSLLISFASLWALRQGSFYKPSFLEYQVEASKFDYIVLGSSIGLTTLNTEVIDSVLGTRGLNLSMDDTALSSQYMMLEHFIASGKQTNICVLAASILDYDVVNNRLSGNDYRFLPYGSRTYVQDYYKSFSGRPAQILFYSKWFPMLGIGYYNTELFYPSIVSLIDSKKRNRFNAFGNYSYPEVSKESKSIEARRELKVAFKNPYMQRIQDLCAKHKIQLVVYIPPHKQIKVQPVEMPFHIINHSATLKNTEYFYDVQHVNVLGRQAASLRFAQEVSGLMGF
ncbi:hypothetical protein OS188_14005 [Xanthomarina sp. F1114]|uniref:hypothetical protein n=1 Tax=Xanthomarina sp. F1114 TaxID=2996019 RepID=UPI00225E0B13|nr:hypothetical protein [Xanthomarina sp. F1114]MCX7549066.1 hypothetical protein [Xanthomarina sp. F1114]